MHKALQRRPLFVFALCYSTGIFIARSWGRPLVWGVGLGLIVLISFITRKQGFLFLCSLLAGGLLTSILLLPPEPLPSTGLLCARIVENESKVWILADATLNNKPIKGRIRLFTEKSNPNYGQWIKANVKIYPPTIVENFGQWDSEFFNRQNSITASAWVTGSIQKEEITWDLYTPFAYTRAYLQQAIDAHCGEEAPIMRALLLGDKSMLSNKTKRDFRRAGVSHVLALSGMHIGVLVGVLLWLLKTLRMGVRSSAIFIISFIWCYTALAGFPSSLVRAALMCTLLLIGRVIGERTDPPTSLAAAFLLILCIHPLELFEVGFQLSFGTMLGIYCLMPTIQRALSFLPKWLCDPLSLTISAQSAILSITAFQFHTTSLVFLPANLLIVPLTSLSMMLGVLLPSLPYAMHTLAELFSGIPWAEVRIGLMPPLSLFAFFLFLAGVSPFFLSKDEKKRCLPLVAALFILPMIMTPLLSPRETTFTMLSVGQGDSFVLQTKKGKVIMIDCGDNAIPLQYVEAFGKTIDLLLLSHDDKDHMGGLSKILDDEMPIGVIYGPQGTKVSNAVSLHQGQKIIIEEGISLEVLWPPKDGYEEFAGENENSLVLLLKAEDVSILLTGDLPKEMEALLPSRDVDVLKVAHHGSKSSSSPDFLQDITPRLSLVSAGQNNSYGHPDQEVVTRLLDYGPMLNTASYGSITLTLDHGTIAVTTFFKEAR